MITMKNMEGPTICYVLAGDWCIEQIEKVGWIDRLKKSLDTLSKRVRIIYLISMDFRSYDSYFRNSKIIHVPAFSLKLTYELRLLPYQVIAFFLTWLYGRKSSLVYLEGPQGVYAAIASRLCGKPILVSYAYSPHKFRQLGKVVFLKRRIMDILETISLRLADGVIVRTESLRADVQRRKGCENIETIPNFIETDMFSPTAEGYDSIRNKLRLEKDRIITFIGRLNYIKGVDVLIKSLKYILKKRKDVRLLIIGDGAERSRLEELARSLSLQNNIDFVGFVKRSYLPRFLIATHVFVFPSRGEGQPKALLEAMSVGKAVVASRVKGIADMIIDGHNGILFTPDCPQDLANKISYLIDRPAFGRILGENGRKYIEDNFSEETILNKWTRFIESFLDGEKTG